MGKLVEFNVFKYVRNLSGKGLSTFKFAQRLTQSEVKSEEVRVEAVNLNHHDFHGEWNYTIAPHLSP
jgi:hypothetical protein